MQIQSIAARAAVFTVIALLGAIANAQESHWADSRNAATWYQRAIEDIDLVTVEEWDLITDYEKILRDGPDPKVRDVLARLRPAMEQMRRGSQQAYSDFGLDLSQGLELQLPHLSKMRGIAKIMNADAMVALHDGRTGDASDRLSSLIRISGHMSDDRTLISSLVGQAIYSLADGTVQAGLDRGALGPVESAALAQANRSLDANDPFGIVEAVAGEQIVVGDWLEKLLLQPDGRQKLADSVSSWADADLITEELQNISDEELAQDLQQYRNLMDVYIEGFASEDPDVGRALLQEVGTTMEGDDVGVIAKLFMPALGRVFDNLIKGRNDVANRLDMLEGIAENRIDPMSEVNAAVWYMRGIALLDKLPPPWLDAIAACRIGDLPSDKVLSTLDRHDPTIRAALKEFAAGSRIRRCDFEPFRLSHETFITPYHPGMRDGMALMTIDAMVAERKGNREGNADPKRAWLYQLGAVVRIAGHLGRDPLMLSSVIAHDGCARATEAINSIAAKTESPLTWTERELHMLNLSVRWISRKDPFGFIASSVHTRESLTDEIEQSIEFLGNGNNKSEVPQGEDQAEAKPEITARDRITDFVESLDDDELVYLRAMKATRYFDGRVREDLEESFELAEQLPEYNAQAVLVLAESDAAALFERIKAAEFPPFDFTDAPRLIEFGAKRRSARRTYRNLTEFIADHAPPEDEDGEQDTMQSDDQ